LPPGLAEQTGPVQADPRVRRYLGPTRILWQSPEGVANAEALLKPQAGQVTLVNRDVCTLRYDKTAPGVLLDFGAELHGGLQLAAGTNGGPKDPVRVRIRFGESAAEAMSDIGGERNATNDHAVRDLETVVPWLGTQEIGNTGFRFVRIDLLEPDTVLELKFARAVFLYRDLEYRGSFRCSDDRLNRIWRTGAYTVHLNMQDYLWDGIKRDRLVWVGDMHPETMTINAVFDRTDVLPRSLDLIRDETPLPQWMNGISSYSIWWVLIHRSWYQQHGDRAYLETQQPYLGDLLDQLLACIGDDGRENLPEGRFLDWPSNANPAAIHAGLHALLILGLDEGAELCEALGDGDRAARCRDGATRLRRYVPDPADSKQAAALMALAGLRPAQDLNQAVMAPGGARGMSTFYGYNVLQARARAGDYQGCLDVIRSYWGGMLDMGATTFWEDFDLAWTEDAGRIDELVPEGKKDLHGDFGNYCYLGYRHSLCHGWASGPTAWMSEHVLGIRVEEPGGGAVRIEPHLGDLDWAEGSYPTPRGLIRVRHEKRPDGRVQSTVELPEGVRRVTD